MQMQRRELPALPASTHTSGVSPLAVRKRFMLLLLASAFVPATLLSAIQAIYDYRQVVSRQEDRIRLAAKLTARSIDQFMESHAAAVALAAVSKSRDAPIDLSALRNQFPALVTTIETDQLGRVVAAAPENLRSRAMGQSVADRDYFRAPASGSKRYVSGAFRGRRLGNEPLVAVSAPYYREGTFAGIVQGAIDVTSFTSLRSKALRQRGQELLIVDQSGQVIHASAGLPYAFLQPIGRSLQLPTSEGLDPDNGVVVASRELPSGEAWIAVTTLPSGWRVALIESKEPALSAVYQHGFQTLLLLLVTGFSAFLVFNWRFGQLADAVGAALRSLRAIAAGESQPTLLRSQFPVELLGIADDTVKLVAQLHESNRHLQVSLRREEELSGALRKANAGLEEAVRARTTELERANRELDRASQTDPLTGALNLRGMRAALSTRTDQSGFLTKPMGVLMLDVDFFKKYNDHYGHPSGDAVLRLLSEATAGELRAEIDQLARVGGEEFLVLAPSANAEVCQRLAERIRSKIYNLCIAHHDGIDSRVTVSIGVATGEVGQHVDTVLRTADDALYTAKRNGRNAWHLATS
ncbi:diguanylate cyclase [Stenotrophomonas sp. STM01]|uniref:sensor domain-containing diguanylate cyclase n=1 Tax=Stenotrophomonas sp. STM01 TaxID=2769278 RepID=UPI00177A9B89|nr:diguanylate cyclase [Stenotrophomonas sp. STM01]MBD9534669.1 diguanylate cyclase [Stenotrophomonas sp. STM01]